MADVKATNSCVLRDGYEYLKNVASKTADKANELYKDGSQEVKQAYDTSASVFNAFDKTSQVAMASTVGGGIVSAASIITLLTGAIKNPTALKVLKGTGLAGLAVFALGSITSIAMSTVNKKAEMDKDKQQENQISSLTADKAKLNGDIQEQKAKMEKQAAEHKKALEAEQAKTAAANAKQAETLKNAKAISVQQGIVSDNTKLLGDAKDTKTLLGKQATAAKAVADADKAHKDADAKVKDLKAKQAKANKNLTPAEALANKNAQKLYDNEFKMYTSEQALIKAWDEYNKWEANGKITKPGTPIPQKPSQADPRKAPGYVAKQEPQKPELIKPEAERMQADINAAQAALKGKADILAKAKQNKQGIDTQVTKAQKAIAEAKKKLDELTTPKKAEPAKKAPAAAKAKVDAAA